MAFYVTWQPYRRSSPFTESCINFDQGRLTTSGTWSCEGIEKVRDSYTVLCWTRKRYSIIDIDLILIFISVFRWYDNCYLAVRKYISNTQPRSDRNFPFHFKRRRSLKMYEGVQIRLDYVHAQFIPRRICIIDTYRFCDAKIRFSAIPIRLCSVIITLLPSILCRVGSLEINKASRIPSARLVSFRARNEEFNWQDNTTAVWSRKRFVIKKNRISNRSEDSHK